ncbi:TMEM165/GDT1 family protein [Anaerotalea alkaliphila]|uniref:GDT1 family protein n=1 Tax=Anaerotalea alkaliphila TaxID=2662126 RepID=A0A7X5HVI3_9FIRM|nr:TMEM165/GDT1 family protein [Anaerotalea alkaliphila]NDL67404.1 TMEM165/GDT1 family protein [Anaerotalea alkaliphila]
MAREYLQALLFIFAAEMGDKTQILAMMFATRFPLSRVLLGIFIGSALNHGFAVAFGSLVGQWVPVHWLQMVAGAAFIGFAIWTLSASGEDGEEAAGAGRDRGAVATVASAFFVGELGDKTQLTAITLAVDAAFPLVVLLGTVSGMLATSSIGIFVGSKLGDRIPEEWIKVLSGTVFLVFGALKLAGAAPRSLLVPPAVLAYGLLVGAGILLLARAVGTALAGGVRRTAYRRAAEALRAYALQMEHSVERICRGVEHCGKCKGERCAIGYMRGLVREMMKERPELEESFLRENMEFIQGKFDRDLLSLSLSRTLSYMETLEDAKGVDAIRRVLEILLFDRTYPWKGNAREHVGVIILDFPGFEKEWEEAHEAEERSWGAP